MRGTFRNASPEGWPRRCSFAFTAVTGSAATGVTPADLDVVRIMKTF
jgi:hypothetical protein